MFMSNHLIGFGARRAAAGGTPLPASLDFESGSSQNLSFTGRAGTSTKGTLSVWLKRESVGAEMDIWSAQTAGGTNEDRLFFDASNKLVFQRNGGSTTNGGFYTTDTYSSTAVWYHLLWACDAAQVGTAKERIKINNVTPAAFDFDSRSSFASYFYFNTVITHWLGRRPNAGAFYDGLMADIRWYDNQYLDASDFGQDVAGTWTRKLTPTVAAFGTNGFHLNGSGAVGTDVSGNATAFTNTNTVVTSATIPPEV